MSSSNPISQERLNQIAQRKLTTLGIPHRLGAHGGLEGELPLTPGRVSHPANGTPLTRAAFRVQGHDHLFFTEAPFCGLPPVQFYDVDNKAMLENRTLQQLQQRVQVLRELDTKLKTLGQTSKLDVELLCLKTVVKGSEQSYELIAGPDGVRVSQVIPRHGEPLPFPDALPILVPMKDLTTATELELFLESSPELRGGPPPAAAPTSPAPARGALRVLPAPAGALRLSALSRFAEEGAFLQGNELVLELETDGRRYRFTAVHERETTFQGRLVGPTGEKWKERFDSARFPGIVPFVRSLLGLSSEPERPAPAPSAPVAARTVTAAALPAHLTPQPGENWVMNVLVERDDGQEVRYVCTNIDGHPYGAPRILAKADFASVFAPHGTGWRLRIRIIDLDADGVSYQQLNPQGELSPTQKKIALNIFASNFLPEAAAY